MNVLVHKKKATSQRSGQCHDVRANVAMFGPTSRRLGQRRDVWANVTTFQKVQFSTSRRKVTIMNEKLENA